MSATGNLIFFDDSSDFLQAVWSTQYMCLTCTVTIVWRMETFEEEGGY
jgi:hypothetical protein